MVGPEYEIFGRVVTPEIVGTSVTTSQYAFDQGIQVDFHNGYYGCVWVDRGRSSQGRDARIYIYTTKLDSDGTFIEGTSSSIDASQFLTETESGTEVTGFLIDGPSRISYPFAVTVQPGTALVTLNFRTGADANWVVHTYAIVLEHTGSFTFSQVLDTSTNPAGVHTYLENSPNQYTHSVPYKNGVLSRITYERGQGGETTNPGFALLVQYIEYSSGSIIAHAPVILYDSFDAPGYQNNNQALWISEGVTSHDATVQIVAPDFGGDQRTLVEVVTENARTSYVDITSVTGGQFNNFWPAEELRLVKVDESTMLVANVNPNDTGFLAPWSFNVVEIFFDGTTLTMGRSLNVANVTQQITGFASREDGTVGFYGMEWQNAYYSGQAAIDYHEQFGLMSHGETDVFTIEIIDIDLSQANIELRYREQPIPFSWYETTSYRTEQESSFTRILRHEGWLVSVTPVQKADNSGVVLSGWSMQYPFALGIPSLRLLQRDDDNDHGHPRIAREQVTSEQKSIRRGPGTYF